MYKYNTWQSLKLDEAQGYEKNVFQIMIFVRTETNTQIQRQTHT